MKLPLSARRVLLRERIAEPGAFSGRGRRIRGNEKAIYAIFSVQSLEYLSNFSLFPLLLFSSFFLPSSFLFLKLVLFVLFFFLVFAVLSFLVSLFVPSRFLVSSHLSVCFFWPGLRGCHGTHRHPGLLRGEQRAERKQKTEEKKGTRAGAVLRRVPRASRKGETPKRRIEEQTQFDEAEIEWQVRKLTVTLHTRKAAAQIIAFLCDRLPGIRQREMWKAATACPTREDHARPLSLRLQWSRRSKEVSFL